VKVARVTSLAKDIAYAMASPDVRILAPIPGKSAIGIEVPNRQRQLVTLGDVLSSEEARNAAHPLEVALGRDIAGRPVMANLADMPHILISGATGAGKSSCINSLLTSILVRSTPEQVRMILVDPKRVELGQYNGLPHLLTQVVVDPKKAANALNWAVAEMERRYDLLAEVGMRDITGYNQAIDRGELGPPPRDAQEAQAEQEARDAKDAGAGRDATFYAADADADDGDDDEVDDGDSLGESDDRSREKSVAARVAEVRQAVESKGTEHSRLPFVLVVVDELNDLMMVAARDVEESVCRIAQMARAVGIHLVLATQRPSVDVITGVIKANIPSRLAFSVSSLADSRVILDQPGAERLIGKGDMLLLTASSSVPRRIQGPWVTEEEVRAVVAHWRRQSQPEYVSGIEGENLVGIGQTGMPGDDDEYLTQAMELVVRSQLGSTSMLQRKLRVGFSRAGRLMDLLERRGVVGPSEGSKARSVLMTVDELDQVLGNVD
jgi:S-DNA-T family DNA segregation ATPase FtsK/SpoIIIE